MKCFAVFTLLALAAQSAYIEGGVELSGDKCKVASCVDGDMNAASNVLKCLKDAKANRECTQAKFKRTYKPINVDSCQAAAEPTKLRRLAAIPTDAQKYSIDLGLVIADGVMDGFPSSLILSDLDTTAIPANKCKNASIYYLKEAGKAAVCAATDGEGYKQNESTEANHIDMVGEFAIGAEAKSLLLSIPKAVVCNPGDITIKVANLYKLNDAPKPNGTNAFTNVAAAAVLSVAGLSLF